MSNNQNRADADPGASKEQLRVVARCLLDYLAVHGKSSQMYNVLQFLAQRTLEHLDEGKPAHFNYFAIRSGVTGDIEGDASAWFSRHWKAIAGDFRQKCEQGIQKFAADRGFDFYPWVEKQESGGGAGNQALISLVALPIPATTEGPLGDTQTPHHDIDYIPAEKLELSWWARWLFDKDRVAHGWRKWLLIWPNLIWFVFVALAAVFLLYAMSRAATPVSTHDLIILIYIGLLTWYAHYTVKRFSRLVDDRMILASDSMVGFREFGVCLELFKPGGAKSNTPKSARMIKYAAQCPTCGAQVLLGEGEPDFPRRIVGRCQESPREHVFSFDRATLTGYRLR